MKYLTVYTTSSRLPFVKSQQGVHHLRTSEQALGGRGEGNGWGRRRSFGELLYVHISNLNSTHRVPACSSGVELYQSMTNHILLTILDQM